MRLSILVFLSCLLAACSHEAENTGSENSSLILPGKYGMNMASAEPSPVTAGRVSRYERKTIVAGGPDGQMSPCAKNFDGIMDNLEALMESNIRENNTIAAEQTSAYKY